MAQQPRTESRPGWREVEDFYAAVAGRWLAANETTRLHPIDQSRDVRCITAKGFREAAHWQRSAGLDQVQHVALHRREVEF